ncbi:MAG: DUF6152 family protein [Gammaproteobacteria bacterium]|nr:DUF6152 family protein [Gammaproteobacteria bacterium]
MNATTNVFTASALSLLVTLPISVSGHHSMAEYDRSVVTEFEGEVVSVSWRNPHILLDIETTDANGETVVWYLEGGAVSMQRRRGVASGLVAAGDHVRVAGSASTQRPHHMLVNHLLLPDGVELLVGSSREPRWSDTGVGGESVVLEADSEVVASANGLFRVWSQGSRAWFFQGRANYELTPEAIAAQAAWNDVDDNPLLSCIAPGMPALMGNPYPMQFVQGDGQIELRFEEFDAVRTIHMENAVDPASVEASHLGYSVGRWEGDTLVVRTTRINWPYFNRIGAPQTENVVVDERITAVDGGNRLDYVMTVTEPATLVEPFVWEAFWTWKQGEAVGLYDCIVEP